MKPLENLLQLGAAAQQLAPELTKLKKSTEDLEAHFMKTLIKEMRKGTEEVHFGKSTGGEIFNDMFDDALATSMSKTGGLGISTLFYQATARPMINKAFTQPPKGTNQS